MRLLACIILALVLGVSADLPPQECPSECNCYYFRIHWVTECAHRGLSTVPENLSPATYVLDLSSNGLSELTLPANVRPRRLLLANNAFAKLKRAQFQGLNLLLEVDLSGNQLSKIDSDTFRDSPGLITLNLRRNTQLTGPTDSDTSFLVLRSLQTLDLAQCGITKIGAGFFSSTPTLRKIDLSGNPLTTVEAGALVSLHGLDELHLSNTNIINLPSSVFPLDAPIRILDLSKTKLDPSGFTSMLSNLNHLEHLDLSGAEMKLSTENHVTAFSNAPWLQQLNLANNNLGELDMTQALEKLKHLENLDLSYCSLNRNSFKGDALKNLTRLRTLKLSGNPLSLNMTVLLKSFSKLQSLTVCNCSLSTTRFLRDLIPLRQSLRSLDLSDNPLGNDEVNAAGSIFPHLESLDVSRCGLTHVTASAFSSATNLVSLAISGNPITRLESGAFSSLNKLTFLHMEDCGMKGAPEANTFLLGSEAPLRELRMAGNHLKPETNKLIPQHLSGLTLLDISRSGIKKLSANSIRYARNLKTLILSDNFLESSDALPPNLGSLAPQLETLDVRRSKLRSLNPSIFTGNDKLTTVYLKDNSWNCNCELVDLWRWATSRGVALQETGGGETLQCAGQTGPWPQMLENLNCA